MLRIYIYRKTEKEYLAAAVRYLPVLAVAVAVNRPWFGTLPYCPRKVLKRETLPSCGSLASLAGYEIKARPAGNPSLCGQF